MDNLVGDPDKRPRPHGEVHPPHSRGRDGTLGARATLLGDTASECQRPRERAMAEFSLGQYLPRAYLADHLSRVPETYGSGDWGQQLFRDSSGRHPVCVCVCPPTANLNQAAALIVLLDARENDSRTQPSRCPSREKGTGKNTGKPPPTVSKIPVGGTSCAALTGTKSIFEEIVITGKSLCPEQGWARADNRENGKTY